MRRIVTAGLLMACAACESGTSGGAVRALSGDDARVISPRPSPDGSRVAWWAPSPDVVSESQLWIANADLSDRRALPVRSQVPWIVWSPDGTRLAVTVSDRNLADVVILSATGEELARVADTPNLEVPIAWHPDGDRVSYAAYAEGGTVRSFSVSIASGMVAPLVPGESRPYLGGWSLDGSRIAYMVFDAGRTTVWLADSAGRNATPLTTDGFEELTIVRPGWSPDGRELVYTSRRTGTLDVWVVNVETGKHRQLTRDVRNDRDPVWSPDGRSIAFISDRGRQTDVWAVPAGGGEAVRITDTREEESEPYWRSATEVAFIATHQQSGVWVSDVAGGAPRRLTPDTARVTWFNLSPDGTRMNYVIARGGGSDELVVQALDGSASRTVVPAGNVIRGALWSPDGSRIAFDSDRGGSWDVWVVDIDGGALRQLVNWPSFDSQSMWNADGSAVFFNSDRDATLGDIWRVPVGGGEPERITRHGSIGGLASARGRRDLFVGVVSSSGRIGWARVEADGRLRTIWDRTNALALFAPPSGDSVIVFAEREGGGNQAMFVSVSGGPGRPVLQPGEGPGNWSPDGTRLLYQFASGGATDLGILEVATGRTQRLTQTPEDEMGAEWTPDGKSVVFRRSATVERLYVADVAKLLARAP